MAETRKKDRRDRRDGYYLRNIDSMHVIMPYVMPHRIANEAVLAEEIDITKIDEYVKKKNEQNPDFKYTWFHVICAALAKTIILKPKMNYFISGYRMYERKNVEVAFTVKRQFNENSEEALAKFIIDKEGKAADGKSPIEQLHSMVADIVTKVRVKKFPNARILKKRGLNFYPLFHS